MLARVELRGDPATAVQLQRRFTVTGGDTAVPPPRRIVDFENHTLAGVGIFDNVDAVLASALDVSPAAVDLQLRVRAVADYVASSPGARADLNTRLREQAVPEFQHWAATRFGTTRNRWMGGSDIGTYGSDYRLRTAANLIGIWANTSSEALYFQAGREEDGSPLNGSNIYLIHFPADQLPDAVVQAYWSVILVSVPDYRVVPNRLGRYNLNSHSDLSYDPDGSLTIAVGPEPVPRGR